MNKALLFALAGLLAGLLVGPLASSRASAQDVSDPDIRNVRPVVMLLVDTSGSMERMSGGSDARLPMCAGSPAGRNERNRWSQMVEALTGTWSDADYYCDAVPRNTASFSGAPDYNYSLPYHRPPLLTPQNTDGILDVYRDRIKFGLMTFDATYTFSDSHPLLVPRTTFMSRIVDNGFARGGYSYGNPQPLTYPGCRTTFMVDSGARNDRAPAGRLISVGTDATDPALINQMIQTQLRDVRPFGGTPTASLLDDFRYYVDNHPDVTAADPFSACRPRFALLLTDGQPDEDFRDSRFNCAASGGCPYDLSREIASDLCRYSSSSGECTGDVDGVFVVAFDVSDPAALAELDDVADMGGTGAALRASNRAELVRRIADVLDRAAPGNTTRSTPAFVTGGSTFSGSGVPAQYQFNAGFRVGDSDTPWTGVLERTAFVCNASLSPEPEPPASRVRFDEELNTRATPRRLLTVVTPDPSDINGNLVGTDASAVPLGATSLAGTVRDQTLRDFDASIAPEYFGIATGSPSSRRTRRDQIVSWIHGTTDDRRDARMGDIYHSSPVAVGPPRVDIADESYNLFRRREEVANRPTVVYVGTNDGILHAFVAEDFTDPSTGTFYPAGFELWGFVPPILLDQLESATTSHQVMLDGTPVIKDIFYQRQPSDAPNGDIYHTVLVMGFRAGAPGYFAMDITDPTDPQFLWQFVGEPESRGRGRSTTPMGLSYGTPAIGQVLVDVGGTLQERAVALLPGGAGSVDEDRARTSGPVGCPAQGVGTPPVTRGTTNARSRQRCWTNTGRILTWVDMVTGEIIQSFDERTFNAPLTGGVALFPGDVGTTAERAVLTDADGVMWTVDFSARRPADWEVRAFHDVFWDEPATVGQPAYYPPIISTDQEGNLVVIQSTGDIDRLDGPLLNRVVSLTETRTFSASGDPTYETSLNWEIRLRPGEQVTGPLELFESSVYFASFETGVTAADACELGQSRIWAVDFLNDGGRPPTGYLDPTSRFPEPRFESTPGTGVFDEHFRGPFEDRLVLGVGVTQRPTCVQGAEEFDPYIGTRYRVNNVGGGTFQLTAQVSGGPASPGEGAISTVTEQLRAPQSFTVVSGFAGQVEN